MVYLFVAAEVHALSSKTTVSVVMTFYQGSLKQSPASMLMTLQQELNTVQVLVALPVLQDFREILVSLIQVQLTWQNEMVTTLESCGFNVRLSDVGEDQKMLCVFSHRHQHRTVVVIVILIAITVM